MKRPKFADKIMIDLHKSGDRHAMDFVTYVEDLEAIADTADRKFLESHVIKHGDIYLAIEALTVIKKYIGAKDAS